MRNHSPMQANARLTVMCVAAFVLVQGIIENIVKGCTNILDRNYNYTGIAKVVGHPEQAAIGCCYSSLRRQASRLEQGASENLETTSETCRECALSW